MRALWVGLKSRLAFRSSGLRPLSDIGHFSLLSLALGVGFSFGLWLATGEGSLASRGGQATAAVVALPQTGSLSHEGADSARVTSKAQTVPGHDDGLPPLPRRKPLSSGGEAKTAGAVYRIQLFAGRNPRRTEAERQRLEARLSAPGCGGRLAGADGRDGGLRQLLPYPQRRRFRGS